MIEMASPEVVKKAKIRTSVAKIIIDGADEKLCYSILYLDPADSRLHIGFSSYKLDFVRKWLAEEFEVVDEPRGTDFANAVRCKDCKNSYENIGGRVCAYGVCVDCEVADDFFCAYGERRDGDKYEVHTMSEIR